MRNNIKVNYCDFAEFKSVLDKVRKGYIIKREAFKYDGRSPIGLNAYLDIQRTKVILTAKIGGKLEQYIFRLDAEDPTQYTNGGEAYKIMKQYVKDLPDLRDDPFYKDFIDNDDISTIGSCFGIASFNPKFNKTRTEGCYGYDLNSAWPYFLCQPIPDTSEHPRIYEVVMKGEIGFDTTNDGNWRLVRPGHIAQYVFKLIESPFKRFVEVWYNKKKAAKTVKDKTKAKGVLNYSIGYLQRVNPFIRAMVICQANEYIETLIYQDGHLRDDVIYWNTDSIVCTHKLPLTIGEELGQWKLQHTGSFALINSTYQWGKDIPTHKGVAKGWYKKRYPNGVDILTDSIPTKQDNIYYITDNNEIKRREYEKD